MKKKAGAEGGGEIYDDTVIHAIQTVLWELRCRDILERSPRNGWMPTLELYEAINKSFGYEENFILTLDEFVKILAKTPDVSKTQKQGVDVNEQKKFYPYMYRYNANGKPM